MSFVLLIAAGLIRKFEFSGLCLTHLRPIPSGIYLLKVGNRNARTRYEICSELTIKTPTRRQWRRFGVFMFKFEHISCSSVSIVNFEHVIAGWDVPFLFIPIPLENVLKSLVRLHLCLRPSTVKTSSV